MKDPDVHFAPENSSAGHGSAQRNSTRRGDSEWVAPLSMMRLRANQSDPFIRKQSRTLPDRSLHEDLVFLLLLPALQVGFHDAQNS
jgi:hypothetical protein